MTASTCAPAGWNSNGASSGNLGVIVTKTLLSDLLGKVVKGKLQLPDVQRGWVWDDEHIQSLLVSIARSFPIGAVMLLETGGEARFQVRAVEGVDLPPNTNPEELILDGQQRLTSLTQVLKLDKPVATRDAKKREFKLHYYFDIEKALLGPQALEDAIVTVDEQRTQREDFGRTVVLDLSTREKEIDAFHFPCSQILNSDDWEQALSEHAPEKLARFMKFRRQVVEPFRNYALPVISLKKETSKEAVCLVFEKVNTGGVPLSVFELITATWAADGFNLRDDWFGGEGQERSPRAPQQETAVARPPAHRLPAGRIAAALAREAHAGSRCRSVRQGSQRRHGQARARPRDAARRVREVG